MPPSSTYPNIQLDQTPARSLRDGPRCVIQPSLTQSNLTY